VHKASACEGEKETLAPVHPYAGSMWLVLQAKATIPEPRA
jgi:hypothetical protein